MLASGRKGMLYIGVTSALWNRVASHKDGAIAGFTRWRDLHEEIDPVATLVTMKDVG